MILNSIVSAVEQLVPHMPGYAYLLDSDGFYRCCNPAQATLFGLKNRLEICLRKNENLPVFMNNPELGKILDFNNYRVMQSATPMQFKEPNQSLNGQLYHLNYYKLPLLDNEKNVVGILSVSFDKTNYEEEFAIKTKHQYEKTALAFKNIIDNLPEHVYWKDKDGRYLGCNLLQAKDLHLDSCEDIIGKTDYDLSPKDKADAFRKIDEKIINEGEKIEAEEIIIKHGEKTVVLSKKIPLYDDNKNIIGLLGISFDISDRKKMEDELLSSKIAAEAANHAKTEFISNMSHDIRTPLTGVVGMAQLLEESCSNPEQKQYARWVYQSGEQLLNMLNGILDVVSADNVNEYDIHEDTFELRECIKDIVELELPTTALKNLDLKVKIDKKAPKFLISDRTKIHRILLNLLGNAIKFTEKGQVTIEVECLEKSNKIALLRFGIRDTGIGIPSDVQDKVFDRFFRASPSYKGVYKGHGVGLHIAQSYAKLLGSTIKLESQVGVGTHFYFDMSCKIGKATATTLTLSDSGPTSDSHAPQQHSATQQSSNKAPYILLVEDNEIARHMVESIASKAGCRFISASDGEQALALAQSTRFDLILTDVGLPGISGHELTRRIRKEEAALHNDPVPIVGLTAHARSNEKSLKSGMNGVFTKPINLPTLQKILNQFVSPIAVNSPSEEPKLGADLPLNEKELFELDKFPVLDATSAIEKMGSEDFLREMLELMLSKAIPEDLKTITKAYEANNWELVEKIAHRMKGGAIYCGTVRLQYACQYLERYRKAGHSSELESLYQQLMRVVEETMQHIKQWLG